MALFFILCVMGISYIALGEVKREHEDLIRNQLVSVLETTHASLRQWIRSRLVDVQHWSTRPEFTKNLKQLLALPPKPEILAKSRPLRALRASLGPILQDNGDLGFSIISPEKLNYGSMRDENLGSRNLIADHGAYLHAAFGGEANIVPPMRTDVLLPGSDGKLRPNEPTMFVLSPLENELGQVIAVVAIQVNPHRDFTRITQIARTGKTGDAFAFNRKGQAISDVRFDHQLRQLKILKSQQRSILNLEIRDPGGDLAEGFQPTTPPEKWPLTRSIQSATEGTSNVDTEGYRDYRGKLVVGAWRWDNTSDFGITFQIDVAEAFAPYYRSRQLIVMALALIFALSIFGLFFLARHQRKLALVNQHLAHEIVERRSMELFLAQAKDDALAANQAKSQFLANMSHEIRTPLNAIIGSSHLALQSDLSDRQHRYLSTIQGSGRSLLDLINGILDFSKIEAGKLSLEKEPFVLEEVINNVIHLASVKADAKNIELLVHQHQDVPNALIGDSLRLGQVLTNLVDNAIKFTEGGEVVLRVERSKSDDGRIWLRFGVQDSGIGISDEQMARLFQAFNQADTSTTRKYGGTGLGLAISKELAELMGGTLEAKSRLGEGSLFEFSAEFSAQATPEDIDYILPADMKKMRVLVVDDNHSSAAILTNILEGLEFAPHAVYSGEEAISEIRRCQQGENSPYQLVLVDMMMPGLDGIATATKILADDGLPSPPTIMMVTAHGKEDIRLRARTAGLKGFMVKPVNASLVFDTIMSAMGRAGRPRATGTLSIPKPTPAFRGRRVLVVEDHPANQLVAEEILKQAGFDVTIASNGKQAVAMVHESNTRFDVILMDLQMPIMDGHAATTELRKHFDQEQLPIIAMTANIMASEKEKCLASGMNDYLSKPIDVKALFTTLGRWIKDASAGEQHKLPQNSTSPSNISLPGIDVSVVLNRLGGNQQLFQRLISQFSERYRHGARDIRTALLVSDGKQIALLAHGLVGIAGTLGAIDVSKTARKLEALAEQNNLTEAGAVLSLLERQLADVVAGVASYEFTQTEESEISHSDDSLATLFSRLHRRLIANEFDAEVSWKELRPHLAQASLSAESSLSKMDDAVARLDFAAARGLLAGYAKTLGVSL